MIPTDPVRVRGPEIVSEIIDGEAIIIDLESGNYYSLQDVGAEIWAAIQEGARVEDLVERLAAEHDGDPHAVRPIVLGLLRELAAESLIEGVAPGSDGHVQPGPRSNGLPFAPPELRKYTDMKELLLLDPIHEVDATGWPAPPDDDGDEAS